MKVTVVSEEYFKGHNKQNIIKLIFVEFINILVQLLLDFVRINYIISLIIRNKGKKIIICSNLNQVKICQNCLKLKLTDYKIIFIKNQFKIKTVPNTLSSLRFLKYLLKRVVSKRFDISGSAKSEARYCNSEILYGLLFYFLKTEKLIMSREESEPFISVLEAAKKKNINILVCEHGVLTRSYTSVEPSENMYHFYSHPANISKRKPIAKNIIKGKSNLYSLYSLVLDELNGNNKYSFEFLIADTLNIRDNLDNIGNAVRRFGDVYLRPHPGISLKTNIKIAKNSKTKNLADSSLIITGVSGFALEAIFCGKKTIIIYTNNDIWSLEYLDICKSLNYVVFVNLDENFESEIECAINTLNNVEISLRQLYSFQNNIAFDSDENIEVINRFV